MPIEQNEINEMIFWRKREMNLNGWNVLDISVKDFMEEINCKDVEACQRALMTNMLEGDSFLVGNDQEITKETTIRFYCDNLSESRRHLY